MLTFCNCCGRETNGFESSARRMVVVVEVALPFCRQRRKCESENQLTFISSPLVDISDLLLLLALRMELSRAIRTTDSAADRRGDIHSALNNEEQGVSSTRTERKQAVVGVLLTSLSPSDSLLSCFESFSS
jgi:hypothetical protein